MHQVPTTTPTALANITADTRYSIQNRSGWVLYVQTTSIAPVNTNGAFAMDASGELSTGIASAPSGENIYVWVADTRLGTGPVVYDEAP